MKTHTNTTHTDRLTLYAIPSFHGGGIKMHLKETICSKWREFFKELTPSRYKMKMTELFALKVYPLAKITLSASFLVKILAK